MPRKILISFGIVFLANLKNANEINGPKVKSDRLPEKIGLDVERTWSGNALACL